MLCSKVGGDIFVRKPAKGGGQNNRELLLTEPSSECPTEVTRPPLGSLEQQQGGGRGAGAAPCALLTRLRSAFHRPG